MNAIDQTILSLDAMVLRLSQKHSCVTPLVKVGGEPCACDCMKFLVYRDTVITCSNCGAKFEETGGGK